MLVELTVLQWKENWMCCVIELKGRYSAETMLTINCWQPKLAAMPMKLKRCSRTNWDIFGFGISSNG